MQIFLSYVTRLDDSNAETTHKDKLEPCYRERDRSDIVALKRSYNAVDILARKQVLSFEIVKSSLSTICTASMFESLICVMSGHRV